MAQVKYDYAAMARAITDEMKDHIEDRGFKRWTVAEDKFLLENKSKMDLWFIAKRMGRTVSSVKGRLAKLSTKTLQNPPKMLGGVVE